MQDIFEPTQIGVENDWSDIAAGDYVAIALKADGTMWIWGYNRYGQWGTGLLDELTQVGFDDDWVAVSTGGFGNILAIKNDDTLWSWDAASGFTEIQTP